MGRGEGEKNQKTPAHISATQYVTRTKHVPHPESRQPASPCHSWTTITTPNRHVAFPATPEIRSLQLQSCARPDHSGHSSDVTDSARGKIKAGGGQLGPDGTIPNSLKLEVVSLALWLWITGFSKNEKLQADERKNYEDALAVLKDVSTGKQKVELPDPGETETTAAPSNAIQVASREPRQFKRNRMKGF